ncbi:ComEC/Rec2 family competence protein [Limnovirga soli]|uniref:DUF4131 domain-containing protein n=1 Tax=Limnovirga soli TaxID=2656915 RepID=A0A8J8FF49_9BACT|nr:ComEC/Rec2 family competence protein [Limnovirga soli]NNV56773.1 DUF4131 domain-containing protein [Limnovirga soli]
MPFLTPKTLKKYPFIRLLAALVAGIILQWYISFSPIFLLSAFLVVLLLLLLFSLLPNARKFTGKWLQGQLILFVFCIAGALLVYSKDIRHRNNWIGAVYQPGDTILISLSEPLVEKTNSYKAQAAVKAIQQNGNWVNVQGNILVYFKKADSLPPLEYGSVIALYKALQPITNSGNPGAFDYNRYCLFQDITAQVFVQDEDYTVLPQSDKNLLQQLIFNTRDAALNTLQQYIPGDKETGVAEALLIGYRNDLDKDLVQAYSNTGVVHIIAISGLHLGMIYALLRVFFSFFKKRKWLLIVQPLSILFVLWAFTLVAGAAPSILRSAVMFTFIVIAESIGRRTNMYNTLAAAAFCMLIYNPFMLWDVGFLLSFAAVISIVSFMVPVYNWFYFKNKLADKIWALTAVTISAQVLTVPIIIFYFHQFPNLFLLTNFIAVPLSGIILYGEIILICLAFIPLVAHYVGIALFGLIWCMNSFIEFINHLPFAVWNNLQISITQTWLLYLIIVSICIWLLRKSITALLFAAGAFAVLALSLSVNWLQAASQQQLIVFNVPKHTAMDVLQGHQYHFKGDEEIVADGFLRNFHLKPARIAFYVNTDTVPLLSIPHNTIFQINNTTVLVIDSLLSLPSPAQKIPVDYIILSHNPPVDLNQLVQFFACKTIVFDSSNPLWKTELWKKDCENLHLRFHSVAQQGAFITDLN